MAIAKIKQIEGTVNMLNMILKSEKGKDDYIEIEGQKPGTQRLYRLTDHQGSRNITALLTCNELWWFVDGMSTMYSRTLSKDCADWQAKHPVDSLVN